MRIQVASIRERRGGVLERSFNWDLEPLEFLGETFAFPAGVSLNARVQNMGPYLWADVQARLSAASRCARCLAPVTTDLECSYAEVFRRRDQPPADDETGPAVRESLYEGDEIDLTQGLLEELLLNLPMKSLCDPHCKGLCAQCGMNWNHGACGCEQDDIDPRLAGLARYFEQRNR